MPDFSKYYEPEKYEDALYAKWEDAGVFHVKKSSSEHTHINILPPPNANGSLHLGHASGYTIMDIAARFARMQGKETLLIPGKDHAGILSQVVFERKLKKERGIDRYALGRDAFYTECFDFCIESADIMRSQEKKMGLSADWEKEKFTLDPDVVKSTQQLFVRMYQEGLAYKADRIINWCPRCATALSDMEVDHKEQQSKLYWITYGPFTVATARPETKLGDTAVAVHPDDKRYKDMVGKVVKIPGVLGKFEVKVIADREVDPEFGTGVVKVTPAHSVVDFEMAERAGDIQIKSVIGLDGRMLANCGKYAGMTTLECREEIVSDMKELGIIEKIDEGYMNKISICERCKTPIEPLVSKQWWIHTDHETYSLKKSALNAVREGRIQIVPNHFTKVFYHWMENLKDWCISRQLWWGIRIPAWYCGDCDESKEYPVVSLDVQTEKMQTCSRCQSTNLVQDDDTFDTWFSSGQWGHLALGSEKMSIASRYYPSDLMVMGRDILFFWACRMMMLSTYATGTPPFKTLYLTGLITDREGKKMSKSKENGIDPLEMSQKYGTDALRLALFIGNAPGSDMRLYEEKIAGYRNFVTKLWNASRFILTMTDEKISESELFSSLSTADQWILHEVNLLIESVSKDFETFQYSSAGQKLYDFVWSEFCDWYLEISKGEKQNTAVLREVMRMVLRLLHPFTPFVTEVLWKQFGSDTILATESWPSPQKDWVFPQASLNIQKVKECISGIRSLRSEYHLLPVTILDTVYVFSKESHVFQEFLPEILRMARIKTLDCTAKEKPKKSASILQEHMELSIPLAGMIDEELEKKRLQKEIQEGQQILTGLEKRLGNTEYLQKAPPHLVEETKRNEKEWREKIEKLKMQLSEL